MIDPVVDLLYRCLVIEVGRNVTNFEHRSHSNFFHQKYPQKTRKTKEALNVQVRMSSFDLQTGIIACCQYTVMQLLVRLCVSHWMLPRVVNYIVHMPVCCGGGKRCWSFVRIDWRMKSGPIKSRILLCFGDVGRYWLKILSLWAIFVCKWE